jgi:hypothetical protein
MSYTNDTKPINAYENGVASLLKEDTYFLLLENGGKILLDQSYNNMPLTNYSNDLKALNSYTFDTK